LVLRRRGQFPAGGVPLRHGPDEGLHRQVHQLGPGAQPQPVWRLPGQGRQHRGLRHGRVRIERHGDRQLRCSLRADQAGLAVVPGADQWHGCGPVRGAATVLGA
jgi:hypothetical protein